MSSISVAAPSARIGLEAGMVQMIADAFEETFGDARAAGHSAETARREGLTAASMFLASLTGMEDEAARAAVDALGLGQDED